MKINKIHKNLDRVVDLSFIKKLFGVDRKLFESALDELSVCFWIQDEDYTIIYGNHAFEEKFGAWGNQICHEFLMGKENVCSCCRSKNILKNMKAEQCKLCKRVNFGYDINIVHVPIINSDGQKVILKSNLISKM